MKQKLILLILCVLVPFLSCTSTEYIKTGNEYPSLEVSEDIQVFTTSKPEQKYETIGLIRIRGGSPEKRIEEAKDHAREKGGNAVIVHEAGILTEPGTDNVIEKVAPSTYETQEFVIIKLETSESLAKAEGHDESIDSSVPVEDLDTGLQDKTAQIDYSSLPRATYSQLTRDYKSLNGKMFRGSLYPKKIYKIPSSLKEGTEAGDRLVLLTTRSGKSNVYLVVGNDKISTVYKKIKSGEIIDFVYSPFNVLTLKSGKKPVIKFVEEVIEAK